MLFWVHRHTTAATERGLVDTARALAVAVDHDLGGSVAALRILGASEALRRGDLGAFRRVARDAVSTQPSWQDVVLYTPDGRTLVSTIVARGAPAPPGGESEPVIRAIRERAPAVSGLFFGRVSGRPVISVVVPLYDGNTPRYALAAIVRAPTLGDALRQQQLPADWVVALTDRHGLILARTRAAEQFVGQSVTADLAAAMAGRTEGTLRAVTKDGIEVYGAFSGGALSGWRVVIGAPTAMVDGPLRSQLGLLAAIGAIFGLVGAVIAAWTARRLTTPILSLAAAAPRLVSGAPVVAARSEIAEVDTVLRAMEAASQERRRIEAANAEHAERLRILHEVDHAMIAEHAPSAIAQAVAEPLRALLGATRVVVGILESRTGAFDVLAIAGRHRLHRGAGLRLPLALAGDLGALTRGEAQLIDVHRLPPSAEAEALSAAGVHVYTMVPMLAGGVLIGVVGVADAAGPLPPDRVGIAQEVATQLAVAIERAGLHERVRRQASELERRVVERTRQLSAANAGLQQEIAERRRAEADAERANRAKSEFLSAMSHELRTPLNAIIGFTQLMHDGKLGAVTADHRGFLADVLASAHHLLGLINDVLDLVRVEAGKLELRPDEMRVEEVIGEVRDGMRPTAARKRMRIDVEIDPALTVVTGDPGRLRQVLYNYVSNALKFSPEDTRVTIRARPEGDDRWRLEVEDQGVGIAAADVDRLFREFEQLDAGSARRHEGTGLGLVLTKRLVEAQGGEVGVRSAPGAGSTFFAVLPRVAVGDALAAAHG
jgi:signal transduction histidine kinase